MKDCTLVILAAGIGSRFGGVKQLEPIGKNGEVIIDYSIRDAVDAGFRKIVFIIRSAIEADFKEMIESRAAKYCAKNGVEIAYALQELDKLPAGFSCPEGRTRPWGTGHALLCCKELVNGPFAVVNADDYYGPSTYKMLVEHLQKEQTWCLIGFRLGNTLSCYGGVTRGICKIENGDLVSVKETKNVCKTENGVEANGESLDADVCVSMNMWGFTPKLFDALQEGFLIFLKENGSDLNKEYLLPEAVDKLLKAGEATVRVLPTKEVWYGMTYREDIPIVKEALKDR